MPMGNGSSQPNSMRRIDSLRVESRWQEFVRPPWLRSGVVTGHRQPLLEPLPSMLPFSPSTKRAPFKPWTDSILPYRFRQDASSATVLNTIATEHSGCTPRWKRALAECTAKPEPAIPARTSSPSLVRSSQSCQASPTPAFPGALRKSNFQLLRRLRGSPKFGEIRVKRANHGWGITGGEFPRRSTFPALTALETCFGDFTSSEKRNASRHHAI